MRWFKNRLFYGGGIFIAVTASRSNQRVLVVVIGSKSRVMRDEKASELVNKAFLAIPQQTAAPAATPAAHPLVPSKPSVTNAVQAVKPAAAQR